MDVSSIQGGKFFMYPNGQFLYLVDTDRYRSLLPVFFNKQERKFVVDVLNALGVAGVLHEHAIADANTFIRILPQNDGGRPVEVVRDLRGRVGRMSYTVILRP